MNIVITRSAADDIAEAYLFYEQQLQGLGDYFEAAILADIRSLAIFSGIHEIHFGIISERSRASSRMRSITRSRSMLFRFLPWPTLDVIPLWLGKDLVEAKPAFELDPASKEISSSGDRY